MLKSHYLILLVTLVALSLYPRNSLAINTNDWENHYRIIPFAAPNENAMKKIAEIILDDGYKTKGNKFNYNQKKNTYTVTLKKPWHDINQLEVMYVVSEIGFQYVVTYHFAKGAITLLDVLNRYGARLVKVSTDSNLNKTIDIILTNDTFDWKDSHPLQGLTRILEPKQAVHLSFFSSDKVNVDTLFFGYLIAR